MKRVYAMIRDDGMVKVGISSDIKSRKLAVSWAVKQAVSVCFATERREDAKAIEGLAHRILKADHCKGEWFFTAPEIAKAAILQAVDIADGLTENPVANVRFSPRKDVLLDEGVGLSLTASSDLIRKMDEWRRRQPDLPSRSEAIRRAMQHTFTEEERAQP